LCVSFQISGPVVEQATTPLQQVYISDLYDYQNNLKGKTFLSPSLVIIGKVVSLHNKFAWFKSNNVHEHYFKPLIKASLINNKQKTETTVLV
ncbi:MAG TPA: hypothetical protein VHP12_04565, partial [Chitinophagaceae bacterium]|nr:hypothetical protein [Chitinophagaceae bacterium]